MPKKALVSKALVDLLEELANYVMEDPEQADDWLDENRSSALSRKKGGIIELHTDHDWKLAFAVWYFGRPVIADKLPRVDG